MFAFLSEEGSLAECYPVAGRLRTRMMEQRTRRVQRPDKKKVTGEEEKKQTGK